MRIKLFAVAILMTLALLACSKKPSQALQPRDYGFELVKLGFEHLYWNKNSLYNNITHSYSDANGVYLFAYEGEFYYHPVAIGHLIQKALSDYHQSGDPRYLDYAEKSAQALTDRAIRSNGGLYFPYHFDFSVYGGQLIYSAPWYSGMAQGTLLSCYSRLYHFTHDPKYRFWADSTFVTFSDYDSAMSPVYITENDSLSLGDGYFWVEEYPSPVRRFVLNGSISGAFGLYDYWWVFGSTQAKRLFSMEMSSVMDHVLEFRNPGDISYYCLKFKFKDPYYHDLHQQLLNQCYLYTGDQRFQALANLLYADYH